MFTVCRIAKKSCRLDWDDYNRCWESIGDEIEKQGGGIGLLGRWYDACTGTVIYFIKGFGHLRMVLKTVGPVRCVKCT